MERCCAVFMRKRPKPDNGRKPAKRRLRIPGSTTACGTIGGPVASGIVVVVVVVGFVKSGACTGTGIR